MPKSILEADFKYVQAKDSTVDRLRERFAQIRAELEATKREQEEKVSEIKPRLKARNA